MSTRAAKGEGGLQTAGDLDHAWWQTARDHEREDQLERRIFTRLTEFDATFGW